MMLTDKEAGEKWCPMVRLAKVTGHGLGDGALAGVTYNTTKRANTCRGSGCMMWRIGQAARRHVVVCDIEHCFAETEPPRPDNVPASWEFVAYDGFDDGDPACWVEPDAEATARMRGYCGLAGRPEVEQ